MGVKGSMKLLPSVKQPGMRPLLIQQELRKGRGFMGVANEYELSVKTHPRYPQLIWFCHNGFQLDNELVRQCRGLILDSLNDWREVARPLDHIFEWSDVNAPTIDWSAKPSPKVIDKVDGQMVYMYYFDGWQVGSLGGPAALNYPLNESMNLHDLFWRAFFDMRYTVPPDSFNMCTFVWELRGAKLAPVVVKRTRNDNENQLNLLAVRHAQSGEEMDPDKFCDQGIRPYVGTFVDESDYTSTEEVLKAVVDTGLEYGEGYVIRDRHFQRIAVTHPEYDTARAFRANLSVEWLLNNVRSKKPTSDIFKYAKDWTSLHYMLAKGYGDLLARMFKTWERDNQITCDTNFAQIVKSYPWGRILQDRRNKEFTTFGDALRKVPVEELLSWLEVAGTDEKAA